mmetsp:Transcript_146354/g.272506  ORF Transcript_146354/g.272506 Transcript_146354/m.272506 type:complete len:230 (-) Transcript_146354:142-831(-)
MTISEGNERRVPPSSWSPLPLVSEIGVVIMSTRTWNASRNTILLLKVDWSARSEAVPGTTESRAHRVLSWSWSLAKISRLSQRCAKAIAGPPPANRTLSGSCRASNFHCIMPWPWIRGVPLAGQRTRHRELWGISRKCRKAIICPRAWSSLSLLFDVKLAPRRISATRSTRILRSPFLFHHGIAPWSRTSSFADCAGTRAKDCSTVSRPDSRRHTLSVVVARPWRIGAI